MMGETETTYYISYENAKATTNITTKKFMAMNIIFFMSISY